MSHAKAGDAASGRARQARAKCCSQALSSRVSIGRVWMRLPSPGRWRWVGRDHRRPRPARRARRRMVGLDEHHTSTSARPAMRISRYSWKLVCTAWPFSRRAPPGPGPGSRRRYGALHLVERGGGIDDLAADGYGDPDLLHLDRPGRDADPAPLRRAAQVAEVGRRPLMPMHRCAAAAKSCPGPTGRRPLLKHPAGAAVS